jgi:hypothetical protein
LSVIIPTIHGIVSVASLWQISEVVLDKGIDLSLTVSQILPLLPPSPFFLFYFFLHAPWLQFM